MEYSEDVQQAAIEMFAAWSDWIAAASQFDWPEGKSGDPPSSPAEVCSEARALIEIGPAMARAGRAMKSFVRAIREAYGERAKDIQLRFTDEYAPWQGRVLVSLPASESAQSKEYGD